MKKISNLLFYSLILFLIIKCIWVSNDFNIIFTIVFLGCSLILGIFDKERRDKFKIDFIDIMVILLSLCYFIPYIFKRNVYPLSQDILSILLEFGIYCAILTLRRYMTKDKINILLMVILTISTVYFFMSFLYQYIPKKMVLLGIYAYFGDTYINSIDRFYGTFDYCNVSALFFAISTFIALFKMDENEENKLLYLGMLFINLLGFLFTFSKMVSIALGVVLLVLIVYLLIRKKYKFIKNILLVMGSLIIPSLLMIRVYRMFLINLNIWLFLVEIVGCIILLFLLYWLFSFIYDKKKVVYFILLIFISGSVFYLTVKPYTCSLNISNVLKNNDSIISDFILEDNKDYNIELNIDIKKNSKTKVALYKLYVEDYYPKEEEIVSYSLDKKVNFKFNSGDNVEYYYIKLIDLDKDINIVIDNLKINGKEYAINTLLVPYQYVHQLDLTKYDKESVSHRFWYYRDSLAIMKDHGFIVGHGKNTFEYYKDKYNFPYLEIDPHSYLFQLWLDVGIYGVIYVALLIIVGIMNMWKNRNGNRVIIWFCIFSVMMIVLPFDCIYSVTYMKALLVLAFVMINDIKVRKKSK